MKFAALVNTPLKFNEYKFTSIQFPLNLGYLSAFVKPHGFGCSLWDFAIEKYNPDEFAARVRREAPRIIGFSCITPNIEQGHGMARIAHAALPGVITLAGGPHGTALPERTLDEFPEFDIVATCEGEETFLEICRAVKEERPLSGIAGTARRADGGITVEPQRPVPADLDSLPFPDRELRPPHLYNGTHPTKIVPRAANMRVAEIITTRGCPFNCFFCAAHNVFQHNTRFRSVANAMAEIAGFRSRYGLDYILFQDDTFVLRRERALEFCEQLAPMKVGWACNARANLVDPALLVSMARAGCRKTVFGIESGSEDILEKIDKKTTPPQIEAAIRAAREAGIETVEGTIIIGSHPSETRQQLMSTLALVRRLDLDFFNADIIVPYPGSPAYDYMKQRGLILSENWRLYVPYGNLPQWRTENFEYPELAAFQKLFMTRYYLRPRYILRRLARIKNPRLFLYFLRMAFDYFRREFLSPLKNK